MTKVFYLVPASSKSYWLVGLLLLLMLGITLLFAWIFFSLSRVSVELQSDSLKIRASAYGRTILKSDLQLDKARILDLYKSREFSAKWRTNGIGLPGYREGWFKLQNKEKALMFVTNTRQVVYIPTRKNFVLMLSLKNPQAFLESLQH